MAMAMTENGQLLTVADCRVWGKTHGSGKFKEIV